MTYPSSKPGFRCCTRQYISIDGISNVFQSIMEFEIPHILEFTADKVPWGLSSSQPDGLDEFLALFDSSCANSEPLDATEFAKAQDLRMMEDFHRIVSQDIPFLCRLNKHVLIQSATFFQRVST